MALNSYTAWLATHFTRRHRLGGQIGFLGRLWPNTTMTFAGYQALAAKWGWSDLAERQDHPPDYFPDDKDFCRLLGYERALAVDVDGREGAEIVFDLNLPLPPELHDRFDVVYNNGTLEHLFNVPMALDNIFKFLRVGGTVIHSCLMNNEVEHGFYQFSPTLFYDYYANNNWSVLDCFIVQHHFSGENHSFRLIPFDTYSFPPNRGEPLYGKLDDKVYDIIFVARKLPESTGDRIPTQYRYAGKRPAGYTSEKRP